MNGLTKEDLPMILQIAQVHKLLGVSKTFIYELIRQKQFPVIEIGCRKVVYRDDLFAWIEARRTHV